MAVFIRHVPYTIDEIALVQALEPVLHGPLFTGAHDEALDYRFRSAHTGTGVLTFPTPGLAHSAIDYFTRVEPFQIQGRQLRFELHNKPPRSGLVDELKRTPYRDPLAILRGRDRLIDIGNSIKVRNVQFVYECRDGVLSPEWEWNSPPYRKALDFRLDETTKEIIIEKFDTEYFSTMIRIRYFSVECIEINNFKEPSFVMFLCQPPSYERAWDHPLFDSLPRKKLIGLDADHTKVSPFTWCCIRVVCDPSQGLGLFKSMVEKVKIPVTERVHQIYPRQHYTLDNRHRLQRWLATIDWEVAFQCESIYRLILLDPQELWNLRGPIEDTIASLGAQGTISVLRCFALKLSKSWGQKNDNDNILDLYHRSESEVGSNTSDPTFGTGMRHFMAYHVDFTPSRMLLSGPFLDVSNRILRLYSNHQNYFLRVSFVDEEGLQLRFDRREVDGSGFVQDRVGVILKNGFSLCGRRYEFLGYSQSALREHTVWFVSPFKRGNITVDGEYIRQKIGTHWPEELLRCPARYAARLSQAFTATDSGMMIEEDQIEVIPDTERNGYCFTDGNGLVSIEAAKAIYAGIRGLPSDISWTPSVFQLRLQGAKGIITVDPTLSGFAIKLRPSMIKFTADHSDVEIARSFDRPLPFFLNRPLSMILDGLGVSHSTFLTLQRLAVKNAQDSVKGFIKATRLFDTHGLGTSFSLSAIFQNLTKIGVPFEKGPDKFIDRFMDRCLQYAVHHVLREIKNRGRIPVPECWKLVGTVDVYDELAENEIFAQIVRGPGAKSEYLRGRILMAKSPTIHPGDVQMVYAIGAPPPGSRLGHLTNTVVFSQRGSRPLPNKLSGSDLDGDEYDLITFEYLHPPTIAEPGSYPPAPKKLLDHSATISDIADFVVDYINSDTLGLIATNFLRIADMHSIFHGDCVILAKLHSWAVDFAKNGKPVPVNNIPYPKNDLKPDWYAPELETAGHAKYYKSASILGVLFRDIELPRIDIEAYRAERYPEDEAAILDLTNTVNNLSLLPTTLEDSVSGRIEIQLKPLVYLTHTDEVAAAMLNLFSRFVTELEHIAYTYSLTIRGTKRLSEEEILIGTILAKTSQPRRREVKISAMREITSLLVKRTLEELKGDPEESINDWANRAWMAWKISVMKQRTFGAKCFGFVALHVLFDVLNALDTDTD